MRRERITTVLWGLALITVVAITVGQAAGQPVLISYVTSDSMEPTISEGDGYLVLPAAVAGPVEEGDVVVFEATSLNQGQGGLTTHRVVDKTGRGYVTKGDGNPFADQSGGEPPVQDAQIVGQAVQIGRGPIVIPHLGTALTGVRNGVESGQRAIAGLLGTRELLGTQGLAYILFGLGSVLFAADFVATNRRGGKARRTRRRRRRPLFPRGVPNVVIALTLSLVLVGALTMFMTVPAGSQQFGIVSAEVNTPNPTTIPAGETATINYTVPNGGLFPIVAYVDPGSDGVQTPSEGISVDPGERKTVPVQFTAPEEVGFYYTYIDEYHYIAVLPEHWIDSLYRTHPLLPILVIDAIVFVPFFGIAMVLLGRGKTRPRSRRSSLSRRFRRLLR